ncbi:MAG: protein-disulfide reductase DsbD domain-containing protein [Acidobacteriota bacterium]
MKRTVAHVVLFLAFTVIAGALSNAGAQTFSGSIARGPVARGGSAKGTIVMSIPAGLHVNSNRPRSQYAIATVVRVSGSGVNVSAVNYPRGKDRKFQFSEDPINVYEGRTAFGFTVMVPAGYRGDTVRVRATVRYQACTEEVCYPPKTKEITLTARVR